MTSVIIRFFLVLSIVSSAFVCGLFAASPAEPIRDVSKGRVLRVGFPIQDGLSFVDDEGNLSGYTYEYLMRLAQYADWRYEFVQLDGDLNTVLTDMLDMLERGELDLIGALIYSDQLARMYDYPGYSYGTSYTALYVLQDDTTLNETNYLTKADLKIATLPSHTRIYRTLVHFCETNRLSPQFVICEDTDEQLAALESGTADVLVNIDVNFLPGVRSIAKFSPQPYYLATTKGNTEIINTLNSAMLKLTKADPTYTATLYEKYFEEPNNSFYLLQEEREFIDGSETIRVGMDSGKAPIQYRDHKTGEPKGISCDILSLIAEKTGLRFEITMVDAQQELYDLYDAGMIDVIAGIVSTNYLANEYLDMSLTDAYLTSQLNMLIHTDAQGSEVPTASLGIPQFNYVKEAQGHDMVTTDYGTIEETIRAVAQGKVGHTYVNSFSSQYYVDYLDLDNVAIIPQVNQHVSILFALRKTSDQNLLSIFNKAIKDISAEQLQDIIYRNASVPENTSFSAFIKAHPLSIVTFIIAIALFIILGLLLLLRIKGNASRKMMIDNERYQKLCQLSNEYIFEYDYAEDKLFVSDDNMHFIENTYAYDPRKQRGAASSEMASRLLLDIIKQDDGEFMTELFCTLPDGSERWLRMSTTTVTSDGMPLYKLGKITDIQRERMEKEQLRELSQRDSLTGLFNASITRSKITDMLQHVDGTLFIIDIDHFKTINDRFGHYMGDQVIIMVSKHLRKIFDLEDIIGRIGGDEFMVFHPSHLSEKQIKDTFAALKDRLANLHLEVGDIPVTISQGVIWIKKGATFATSYQKVDEAMYMAKKAGRNTYRMC